MGSKVLVSLVLCVFVAGIACAENNISHSEPKSVASTCSENSAVITWDPIRDEDLLGYDVYYKMSIENDFLKANSDLLITTQTTVGSLLNNLEYEFKVIAIYDIAPSLLESDVVTCTTS